MKSQRGCGEPETVQHQSQWQDCTKCTHARVPICVQASAAGLLLAIKLTIAHSVNALLSQLHCLLAPFSRSYKHKELCHSLCGPQLAQLPGAEFCIVPCCCCCCCSCLCLSRLVFQQVHAGQALTLTLLIRLRSPTRDHNEDLHIKVCWCRCQNASCTHVRCTMMHNQQPSE